MPIAASAVAEVVVGCTCKDGDIASLLNAPELAHVKRRRAFTIPISPSTLSIIRRPSETGRQCDLQMNDDEIRGSRVMTVIEIAVS